MVGLFSPLFRGLNICACRSSSRHLHPYHQPIPLWMAINGDSLRMHFLFLTDMVSDMWHDDMTSDMTSWHDMTWHVAWRHDMTSCHDTWHVTGHYIRQDMTLHVTIHGMSQDMTFDKTCDETCQWSTETRHKQFNLPCSRAENQNLDDLGPP